ncbi:MAG TPA: CpaF family protein, partial [Candidatus Wallbacteria bacterium]|nr:CpaF family protein [Candidatus Wallbacteria bacterium]
FALPTKTIREMITGSVDIIVQASRLRDGSRKITHITEVVGMEGEVVTLQDIFVFREEGRDNMGRIAGRIVPTGIRPKFMSKFEEEGIKLPADIFMDSKRGW